MLDRDSGSTVGEAGATAAVHTSDVPSRSKDDRRKRPRTIRSIDLFAGAGGLSLAARQAGIKVVAAVEMHPRACETYRANLVEGSSGNTVLYEADISTLEPEQLQATNFSASKPCDIVLGGPPCQGFSTHRIKSAGVGDPRNELLLRYFAFVEVLTPKVFLMENVPGILWPRHKEFLDGFYSLGRAAGYHVHPPVVLDARDYGVPQRRKRVFILGVHNGSNIQINWPPHPTHADSGSGADSNRLQPWLTAESVFSSPVGKWDMNDVHMNHSDSLVKAFAATPHNGGSRNQSGRTLPCHSKHDGHWDVYGRIDPKLPGPTMTTVCINPSKGRFVHPTENHGITVRQAARFQTFPDDFMFHGGLMSAGEQIGNAVPVALGKALLLSIKRAIIQSRRAEIEAEESVHS